jgi:HEPN domain-containing protein
MNPGDVRDWLEQAHGDLRYAKLGRADRTILLNLVGFHAQQAVAKAIKALLW